MGLREMKGGLMALVEGGLGFLLCSGRLRNRSAWVVNLGFWIRLGLRRAFYCFLYLLKVDQWSLDNGQWLRLLDSSFSNMRWAGAQKRIGHPHWLISFPDFCEGPKCGKRVFAHGLPGRLVRLLMSALCCFRGAASHGLSGCILYQTLR